MEKTSTGKYVLLMVLFLIAFGLGFVSGKGQGKVVPVENVVNTQTGKPDAVDFSLFWDSWRIVQESYAKRESLNVQNMVYGAISGMVKSLDDPYTVFFNPEDAKKFKDDVNGSFEGVGMQIGIKQQQIVVIAPLEGTPAKAAGILPGDAILKIGDKSTKDISLDEAISLIRGPKGTPVVLSIMRSSWKEPKDISITRDIIKVPSLKWQMKNNDVAYIQLFQFSRLAGTSFSQAASEILQSKAKSIVLDLRGNPGGYLDVAVDIAGWFIDRGQTVVTEDFGGDNKKVHQAQGSGRLAQYPMVVLINGGSASASEILAGALRDEKGIKLVGEKSFGKGSVQEVKDLRLGASLKVTVANWLTPKGNFISGVGLEPDVKVDFTQADNEKGIDPQLARALEMVKNF